MDNWTVYIHRNKINNKRYIGITSFAVEYRWKNGEGYREQLFYYAIQKYGWDNFEHIIYATNLTEEEAKQLEKQLIKEYHTYIGDENCQGYNATLGGDGNNTIDYDEVFKMWDDGKALFEIAELTGHSSTVLSRILQNYSNYSSEESKRRSYERRIMPMCQAVDQYDLDGNYITTYPSQSEAFFAVRGYHTYNKDTKQHIANGIQRACKIEDNSHAAYGYQWRYANDPAPGKYEPKRKKTGRPVEQYTKNGEYVATYWSLREAARRVNMADCTTIQRVCSNHRGTAKGYLWKYEDEPIWWNI